MPCTSLNSSKYELTQHISFKLWEGGGVIVWFIRFLVIVHRDWFFTRCLLAQLSGAWFLLTTVPGPGSVRISRLGIVTCSAVLQECRCASQCPRMSHKYGSHNTCGIVYVTASQCSGLIKANRRCTPLRVTALHAQNNATKSHFFSWLLIYSQIEIQIKSLNAMNIEGFCSFTVQATWAAAAD